MTNSETSTRETLKAKPTPAVQTGEVVSLEDASLKRLARCEELVENWKRHIGEIEKHLSGLQERVIAENKHGLDTAAAEDAISRANNKMEQARATLKEAETEAAKERERSARLAEHRTRGGRENAA